MMNSTELKRRLHQVKIPLAIMAFALLLLLSTGKSSPERENTSKTENEWIPVSIEEEEQRLTETLQTIQGVGKARVLLSTKISSQTDYLSDGEKTVVLSVGSGRQQALPYRTKSPEYLGAVIVCEGGDDPKIQWNVLEAVSKYTGLRADQIKVMKYQQ